MGKVAILVIEDGAVCESELVNVFSTSVKDNLRPHMTNPLLLI
jgi:hypothetical protein